MSKRQKLNVGFVTTVSGRWPRDLPKERHEKYSKWLESGFDRISLVKSNGLVISRGDVDETIETFRRKAVDLVVIVVGAFTGDITAVRIAERLGVPVILWALPEPPFDGGRIMCNALVAATMNSAALKRLGLTSHFIYGDIDDNRVRREISAYITTYAAAKNLRNTFLGLIGYRPTGFYSSTFDETLIRKTFGLSMEAFDLVHVMNVADGLEDRVIEDDVARFSDSIRVEGLPDEYLRNHSRLYLAVKKVAEDIGFDALCLRCWPELGDMKCTPCAVISRLADEGLITGCEGDVDATISMLIENFIAEEMTFMGDLIDVGEADNTVLFWHCGQAGRGLHGNGKISLACDHSLAGRGVVIEGVLKAGPVTVARMSQTGNGYKLLLARGEAVETDKVLKGVMTNVRMERPVLDLIYKIAKEGIPHHYSLVWKDIYEKMKLFAELLDIEVV